MFEEAYILLLHTLTHLASTHETRSRAVHLRAELERQLTPTQIEAIQAHAGEKTFESVVEELLN